MSSELERLFREGARVLPEPDAAATSRARVRALAAGLRRRRRRRASPLVLAVALVVAIGLGVGIGASIAPSGTAAGGPVGIGFLPENGWYVTQNGADATPERPVIAIASNVQLSPDDGTSIVPYSTLQSLPHAGIVLVANFTGRGQYQPYGSAEFPSRELPLSVREARPYILYSAQIRPDQPLGQYQLRGAVKGYAVDLHMYFGTPEPSEELLAEAQLQLDRLVVAPDEPPAPRATRPSVTTAAAQSVTLTFVRFYDNACRCYKARLSGRISSGQAGEYVVVLRQYCGRSFATAVSGATTREGGFWEAELPIVSRPEALVSESYRARWNGRLSEPVRFRGPLSVSGERLTSGRQRVTVFTGTNNPVNLRGRQVVLQRRVARQWTRIASARLAPHRTKYYTFTATLTVRQRGWTLRALVPAKAAAPCFVASPSEKWTS